MTRPTPSKHACDTRRLLTSIIAAVTVLLLAVTGRVHGQTTDLKGSKDHPVISRYAGSLIIGYDVRKFDEFVLPLGPTVNRPGQGSVTKTETLAGRLTRIMYIAPAQRTTLEVFRNYEQELKRAGFQTLFSCSDKTCDKNYALSAVLYPPERMPSAYGANTAFKPYVFSNSQEQRYLAAKRANGSGASHVSVLVALNTYGDLSGRVVVLVDVIESVAMDTGMVKVDAAAMAKEIAQTGHVALYGIGFDSNKADVKPESQTALQEIATLLKQNPKLTLLVVGHTDNVGGFDANMALSSRRATAVVQEMTTKYGIAAARLRAVGVGMVAPVAPNDTEEGKAKNRRVELVKQ